MAILTSWSLQSPNLTNWVPSVSAVGIVTYVPGGGVITATPPVLGDRDTPTNVWTLAISNAGIVTITSGADSGQNRAALIDPLGTQYLGIVTGGIAYFIPPSVRVGDLLTFGLFNQEAVPLIVKSIAPGPDLTAVITFVDAAPGVHLATTGNIPAFDSHITLPRIGLEQVAKPLLDQVASDETVMLRSTDGSLVPRIVISLHFASSALEPALELEVQHRLSGATSPWQVAIYPATATMQVSITAVAEGLLYDLRLRSRGTNGSTSSWATLDHYTVVGKTSPPPDVTALALNERRLVWAYPDAPLDLLGFEVRVNVGDRISWGDAIPLHDGMISQTSFQLFRDSGVRTYLVKALDTSLNESVNAASLLVDWGTLATTNVAEVIDLKQLGFPGTLTGGSVLGGNLVSNSDTLFWKSDGQPFWTTDPTLFWQGTFTGLVYTASIVPPITWLGGTLLLDLQFAGIGYKLEYAVDGDAAFWDSDESQLFWTNDTAIMWTAGVGVYKPWLGSLSSYLRQPYLIRLTTTAGGIQSVVSQFQVVFDMPDLVETLLNVALAAGGTRLPITKSYVAITIVSSTLVEDFSGAVRIRVLDKDTVVGPMVQAVDQSNVPVNAHSDFLVKGY